MKYYYSVEQFLNKDGQNYGDGFCYREFKTKQEAIKYFNQIKKDTKGIIHRYNDKLITYLSLITENYEIVNIIKSFEQKF